jgi:xanthine phosphoribosyltransferase
MNKLIIKQHEFKGMVAKICRSICLSDWKPDYIVGISRGGLIPAVMISQYLNVPMKPLQVSLRDSGECVSDLGIAEDAFGHDSTPKNILIVDDINDTGSTFNWIINDWPSGCFPDDPKWSNVWNQNVRFAVLVDNLASDCEYAMDYTGIEINKAENDVWVDFPWEEWWTK